MTVTNAGGAIGSGNIALRKSGFDEWHGFDVRLGRGVRLPACEENYVFFETHRTRISDGLHTSGGDHSLAVANF